MLLGSHLECRSQKTPPNYLPSTVVLTSSPGSSQASREIRLQKGVQGGASLCAPWLGLELVKQVL